MDAQWIEKGIWLGSLTAAIDNNDLKTMGITKIISVCDRLNALHRPIEYKWIKIDDDEQANLLQFIPKLMRWISKLLKQGDTIFVHCQNGISRSAAIVAAWLMKVHDWDPTMAETFLRGKRPCIKINDGFRKQLWQWHQSLQRIQAKRQRTLLISLIKLHIDGKAARIVSFLL
jgi:dual specificity phosphatase 12